MEREPGFSQLRAESRIEEDLAERSRQRRGRKRFGGDPCLPVEQPFGGASERETHDGNSTAHRLESDESERLRQPCRVGENGRPRVGLLQRGTVEPAAQGEPLRRKTSKKLGRWPGSDDAEPPRDVVEFGERFDEKTHALVLCESSDEEKLAAGGAFPRRNAVRNDRDASGVRAMCDGEFRNVSARRDQKRQSTPSGP